MAAIMAANFEWHKISAFKILKTAYRYRKILIATTRVELIKKYSGSILGPLWLFIFPVVLLAIYLFIYTIVFPVRLPNFGGLDFALFVFAGLIPYLGLVEVLGIGTMAVKQNIHLVKNVMMPIELVPIRSVIIGSVSQIISLVVLIALAAANGSLSFHILWLPIVLGLQFLFLLGLVYFFSALAVSLPDIGYLVNLLLMLLMFISPIGYKPDMLPAEYMPMIYLNPVYYLTEVFRDSIIFGQFPSPGVAVVYVLICTVVFIAGTGFFVRFKNVLIDYE